MNKIQLAVNGSLMRGLALNGNLIQAGAVFVKEDQTSPNYRLWSIRDTYPAMLRDETEGVKISLEIWELSPEGLLDVVEKEPPGLCLGKIELLDETWIFGVLGEPYLCDGKKEITRWGGWRNYCCSK
ncbi:MAG: hypothetical protein MUP11_05160 [Anaerolineales bacterium]|nr:hypothetical protein [Anaerolineales bacterium]